MGFQITEPPSTGYTNRNSRSGIALVVILWVLVVLALIATSFTKASRQDVQLTGNLLENARAEALADAGIYRAIQDLREPISQGLITPELENLMRLGNMTSPAENSSGIFKPI